LGSGVAGTSPPRRTPACCPDGARNRGSRNCEGANHPGRSIKTRQVAPTAPPSPR
jgi:hypothetical protein